MLRLISLITIGFAVLWGGLFFLMKQNEENFTVEYPGGLQKLKTNIVSTVTYVADIENQKPLTNPPAVIKAIYATAYTAGGKGMDRLIDIIKKTEINAVIIDIKDYSGLISYNTGVPEVIKYNAREVRTPRINTLIKRLHDDGIYVIARQTVFQDPALVKARPDLAVLNKNTGKAWADHKGITWADPASEEVWEYNIAIAKDALARGFDEINFDYIRFPSDGNMSVMQYPFYNPETTYKKDVIRKFFSHLRTSLPNSIISADLFGYTAILNNDLGIGQIIEYAYENFDYVAPMIYPSHFNPNFLGYPKPANNPYEVIAYTTEIAFQRLHKYLAGASSTASIADVVNNPAPVNRAKLRPWLQDFTIYGVVYGADKVSAQINAVYDSVCMAAKIPVPDGTTCDPSKVADYGSLYGGWMMWNASNNYTVKAFMTE